MAMICSALNSAFISAVSLVVVLFTIVSFGQSNEIEGKVSFEDVTVHQVNISVSVKSAEEVKSTFEVSDIKELISHVEPNEELNFEIICEGKDKIVGEPTTLTYRIKGDSNNQKEFLQRVKKVRKAALKYYKNL